MRKLVLGMNRGREVSKGDCGRVVREVGGNLGSVGLWRLREEWWEKGIEKRI